MFLKQYNYKPRSGSQSSADTMSSNTDSPSAGGGAVKGGASSEPTGANSDRKQSTSSSAYAGLMNQKRTGDADSDARKASFMEQKPGGGNPIQNAWNNFTKGPTGAG